MANPILVARGPKADMPNLMNGRIYFCTDTGEFYIGNNGNQACVQSGTTERPGVVKLNDSINSTSTSEAATANAVRQVNEGVEQLNEAVQNAIAASASPNPAFDSLYYRSGLKGATTFGTNNVTKTITIVSSGLVLATKVTTFGTNTATVVTTFNARTFMLDGVTITTLAKTDTSTFNFSNMTWQ